LTTLCDVSQCWPVCTMTREHRQHLVHSRSLSVQLKLNQQATSRHGHKQDAYTLHRQVRKRFPRNPYSVNNILDVFECDLVDVQALSKHNDGHKYLLTVIDVFSKFLHKVPLKSKSRKDVSSAFRSVLQDPIYLNPFKRRPIWVRTDKGKAFLNLTFQNLLKHEGIHFQVCRNPDIKCSVVERAKRTISCRARKAHNTR